METSYDIAAQHAIGLVKNIIDTFGPRVSGSQNNYNAVNELEKTVGKICSTIRRETFSIHPNSLFAIGRIFGLLYVLGLLALLINNPILTFLGVASLLCGMIFCTAQFILYSDIFDGLFKSVEGNNVVGYIEPQDSVKEQIILVGHHDSSYIYPFHETLPLIFPIRLFIPIILFLFELAVLIIRVCGGFGAENPVWIQYVSAMGLIFVIPMFWYISKRPSPGAGDNLTGCAIGISILELLRDKLKNTRLVLLLTDGEEVGQKGARYFVNTNLQNLKAIPTKAIVIDSIYTKEDLTILQSDRNGFSKLSSELIRDLNDIAEQKGHNLKVRPMPLGGGGTDGGQFARRGIETVSIIGMPTTLIRKEILIHTKNDVPEKINRDAVSTVIEMVTEYIKARDTELT